MVSIALDMHSIGLISAFAENVASAFRVDRLCLGSYIYRGGILPM